MPVDRGDTLVEILIALLVVSIAGVALVTAFSSSIGGSAVHRTLATSTVAVRDAADSAFASIENGNYASCATTYSPSFSVPPDYSAEVTSITLAGVTYNPVEYWDSTSSQWTTSCPAGSRGSQLVSIKVLHLGGTVGLTQVVVDGSSVNAGGGGSGGGGGGGGSGASVSGVSPSWLNQGATSQSLTVTGSGFTSASTVSFGNSGIKPNAVTMMNSSTLIVNVTIPATTPTGWYPVTVPGGAASGSSAPLFGVFAVVVPPSWIMQGGYSPGQASYAELLCGWGYTPWQTKTIGNQTVTLPGATVIFTDQDSNETVTPVSSPGVTTPWPSGCQYQSQADPSPTPLGQQGPVPTALAVSIDDTSQGPAPGPGTVAVYNPDGSSGSNTLYIDSMSPGCVPPSGVTSALTGQSKKTMPSNTCTFNLYGVGAGTVSLTASGPSGTNFTVSPSSQSFTSGTGNESVTATISQTKGTPQNGATVTLTFPPPAGLPGSPSSVALTFVVALTTGN